ncbi:hypothetical protein Rhopal_006870-T1 [Rhodotorula paludigena]|uniref:Uncharacterized protein n=1 Tax=Rhodotorula paludigena TaxID=86838 RepID=A0AAV5GWF8_9BASI|nr:hypothetical protein Rhopal_006870-T1 [Rhodotorula paludigena]
MLESVRSRRVYGASLVIVLPLAGALGYYLRTRHDDDVSSSASAILASSSSSSPSSAFASIPPPPRKLTPAEEVALLKEQAAVEERVRMLRRKEGVLADEAKELRDKLERVRNRGHAV